MGDKRTRDRFGVYGWAEVQPWRRWAMGVRYDWTQYPTNPGHQWAVGAVRELHALGVPEIPAGLQAHRANRTARASIVNGGSGRIMDEWFFQATFILGAHPAHAF